MTQFEAVIEYAGKRVKVKSDSFEELHATLAGIEELNQDADYLKTEKGIEEIIPVYRKDADENEYYGLQDRRSRKNVTYGKKRGEAMIPFFPKGADGYYDPDAQGPRRPPQRRRPPAEEAREGERPTRSEEEPRRHRTSGGASGRRNRPANGRSPSTPPSQARPAPSDDLPF